VTSITLMPSNGRAIACSSIASLVIVSVKPIRSTDGQPIDLILRACTEVRPADFGTNLSKSAIAISIARRLEG
jgi:hypothetical protein